MDVAGIVSAVGWFWLVLAIVFFLIAGYLARKGDEEGAIGWAKWGALFALLWAGSQMVAQSLGSPEHVVVAGALGWLGATVMLVALTHWWGFVVVAAFAFAYSVAALGVPLAEGLLAGLLLAWIDFIVENAGGALGLWRVKRSSLLLGHQPIEVFLVCLFVGGPWFFLAPANLGGLVMWVLFTALFGAVAEHFLTLLGYMEYSPRWDFFKAVALYTVAFAVFYALASLAF